MVALAIRLFIKDKENIASPSVRQKYGVVCGACGIFFNILLFAAKFIIGTLTRSIAVTADAFNNISDAGSSLVTMIGFRLSEKKPDPEHPFGHGRLEYIAGLIVAMLIFVMGFELALSSFEAISDPQPVDFSWISVGILVLSMLVKLYMLIYNRRYGKKISSPTMQATAIDSLSDVAATGAVLISLIISNYTGLMLDGYIGLVVAGFILFSGFKAAKETLEPLLGERPDKQLVDDVEKLVLSHPPVTGVHDLILHDYGPGRRFMSLHAEVPMDEDILFVHDVIDNIEGDIETAYGIETVIHMDPIDTRDARLVELRETVNSALAAIGPDMNAHDFRLVPGQTHTNVIFDVVMPADSTLDENVVKKSIALAVTAKYPSYRCVIKIDRSYA